MKLIKDKINLNELNRMAKSRFGNLIKAVVDVEKEIMVVGGPLHSDQEALLLEKGSKQSNLWGINLYPESNKKRWVEFDSMLNLRPHEENLTRGVDDPKIQKQITEIVNKLVER